MSPPALSVVMPVYNCAAYVDDAVRSVLDQTFRDFEFVILDNGSQDASVEILRRWAARDDRIRLIEEAEPLGIAGSSNVATRHARAPLIARMDADDRSKPERFAREVPLLSARRDDVLVAAMSDFIDERGRVVRPPDRWFLLRPRVRPPFSHGSIIYRREAFERVGGYRAEAGSWADLDFIQRLGEVGGFAVLTDALYEHRFTATSTTSGAALDRAIESHSSRHRCVRARLDREPPKERAMAANALYEREAMHLWAGHRPRLLGELLSRRLISPTPSSVVILAWAGAAFVWPSGLRRAVRTILWARDRVSRARLGSQEVIYWRFG